MTAFDIAMSLLREQESKKGKENSIQPVDNAEILENMKPPPNTADPQDMSKLCAYNAGEITHATEVKEKETSGQGPESPESPESLESTSGHSMGG